MVKADRNYFKKNTAEVSGIQFHWVSPLNRVYLGAGNAAIGDTTQLETAGLERSVISPNDILGHGLDNKRQGWNSFDQ